MLKYFSTNVHENKVINTAILADSAEEMPILLDRINFLCTEYGLKMNIKKTKFMIITKILNLQKNINLLEKQPEQATKYKYLRSWVTQNSEKTTEIRQRIEKKYVRKTKENNTM